MNNTVLDRARTVCYARMIALAFNGGHMANDHDRSHFAHKRDINRMRCWQSDRLASNWLPAASAEYDAMMADQEAWNEACMWWERRKQDELRQEYVDEYMEATSPYWD